MSKNNLIAEPDKQTVSQERIFSATPEQLFKICSDPALIPQWWGPKDLSTIVAKMEMKKGGIWRFIHKDAEGNEFAFNGVYHEIIPNIRVTNTFEFEPMAGHILLETITFEPLEDGKTKLKSLSVFQSVEDRDGMVESGMESGATESWDRLEELAQSQK